MATEPPIELRKLKRDITAIDSALQQRVTQEAFALAQSESAQLQAALAAALDRIGELETRSDAQNPINVAPFYLSQPFLVGGFLAGDDVVVDIGRSYGTLPITPVITGEHFNTGTSEWDEVETGLYTSLLWGGIPAGLVRLKAILTNSVGTSDPFYSREYNIPAIGDTPRFGEGAEAPTLTPGGAVQVGAAALAIDYGETYGDPVPEAEWALYRVPAAGGAPVFITDTPGATYTYVEADIGHFIELTGLLSNINGNASISIRTATAVLAAAAPPPPEVTYTLLGTEHVAVSFPATINGFAIPSGYGVPCEFGGFVSLTAPETNDPDDGNPRIGGVIYNGQVVSATLFGNQDPNVGVRKGVWYRSTLVVGDLVPPVVAPPPPPTGARDPLLQPFASSSIWNMPLGADKTTTATPIFRAYADVWTSWPYSDDNPLLLDRNAPMTQIRQNGGWSAADRCQPQPGVLVSVPFPSGYLIGAESGNLAAACIGQDGRTLYSMQPLTRCSGNLPTASFYPTTGAGNGEAAITDLYGHGKWGAQGGSRLSSIGGTLRRGELRPGGDGTGPKHALKILLDMAYARRPQGGSAADGRVWPAISVDSYWNTYYGSGFGPGTGGPFRMGQLFCLLMSFNRNLLITEPAKKLAWTLQYFGAYLVDDARSQLGWCTEIGPGGKFTAQFQSDYGFPFHARFNATGSETTSSHRRWMLDMRIISDNLHMVTNSSESVIGGPGARVWALAPAIAP